MTIDDARKIASLIKILDEAEDWVADLSSAPRAFIEMKFYETTSDSVFRFGKGLIVPKDIAVQMLQSVATSAAAVLSEFGVTMP